MTPVSRAVADHRLDERPQLVRARLAAAHASTDVGQQRRRHDAGRHGVLPVVAHVRDAVGPAHDLALGRRRRGTRPRVVADAVERLVAQVERRRATRRLPTRRGRSPRGGRCRGRPRSCARPGPWPQSCPSAMASVSATFRRRTRAIPVATCATSSAWVSRVRWWSAGKTKTWVLPARRRNAVECRIRSRSRSKHVRHGSGSSGLARRPAARRASPPGRAPGPRTPPVRGARAPVRRRPRRFRRFRRRRPRRAARSSRRGRDAPRSRRGRPWSTPTAGPARSGGQSGPCP